MMRRLTALFVRRRAVTVGIAGLLLGFAAFGSPALAYFSGTTTSQTLSLSTGSFSCFTESPADNPWFYYAYDNPSSTSLIDSGSNGNTGTNNGSTGMDGSCAGGSSPYLNVGTANGVTNYYGGGGAVSPRVSTAPTNFTLETWFKTTSTNGGDLISFGDQPKTASSTVDRALYMRNSGTILFTLTPSSGTVHITSPSSYNDGAWHMVDAVFSTSNGMSLYVDGTSVASNSSYTSTSSLSRGYWRIGYDDLSWAPGNPTENSFGGSFDDTAVYNTALTSAQITAHLAASELAPCVARSPLNSPYFYYSYNQVSGTSITDSGSSGNTGLLSGGTVSSVACTAGASPVLTLASGDAGASVAASNMSASQAITLETWFKTTTTTGGWLVGLGGPPPGSTTDKDRAIYMTNSGQLSYNAWNGSASRYLTSSGSYNDGNWHQVIVTMTAASGSTLGTTMYVDGAKVASDSTITTGQSRNGAYWRIGYSDMGGWTNAPTSDTFVGSLEDTAVYMSAITAAQASAHYNEPR